MTKTPAEAFPLSWPDGWTRTPSYKRKRHPKYQVGKSQAIQDLQDELGRWGVRYVVISSNIPLRHDGLPRKTANEPDDPGVAVYFTRRGMPQVIACDVWDRVKDNIRACWQSIQALRAIERAGATEVLDKAFQGFKALPAGNGAECRPWWVVLGVNRDSSLRSVEVAYRSEAFHAHPDQGGNDAAMAELNNAIEQARAELRKGT